MKQLSAIQSAGRAGFSLVELAVVAAVLSIALGLIAMIAGAGNKMYRTESIVSHLESQVAVTMEQILDELRIAGNDTFAPDPLQGAGSSSVQYVQATGLANGQAVWTPQRRLELEYETGELDDGLDNNGNGLIDEGQLVLTEDVGGPSEQRRVLTRWVPERLRGELENGVDDNGNGLVDERGFCVERVGETLVVRLTLQRRTYEGAVLTRTAQSSTRPRNRMVPQS